jgi:hypothetical protein
MVTEVEQAEAGAWERLDDEPPHAHEAFRIYRDLPPAQRTMAAVATQVDAAERTLRGWAERWDWRERSAQWDDACHRVEDQERLDALRSMHATHRRAGRAAVVKAMQALSTMVPEDMPPSAVARLLELGARLERSTLIVSVEELQGVEVDEYEEDPWERIANELEPPHHDDDDDDPFAD